MALPKVSAVGFFDSLTVSALGFVDEVLAATEVVRLPKLGAVGFFDTLTVSALGFVDENLVGEVPSGGDGGTTAIKHGSTTITAIYHGSTQVTKVLALPWFLVVSRLKCWECLHSAKRRFPLTLSARRKLPLRR